METNYLKKYDLENHDAKFYYQFLDRLRSDCAYYLGNGGRYSGHLWTHDEYEQIELMRAVYKILPIPPEWLTWEQINEIARKLLPQNTADEAIPNKGGE